MPYAAARSRSISMTNSGWPSSTPTRTLVTSGTSCEPGGDECGVGHGGVHVLATDAHREVGLAGAEQLAAERVA
jgi:hypothetical protein